MDGNNKVNLEKKLGNDDIYPITEPGVINKTMIVNAFLEDGYKGEESRLHKLAPLVYNNITALRLNYKNILRIDHLWILPNLTKLSLSCNKIEVIESIDMLINLKELDLSFNYIEKIQNLEKLLNLEVLTLFSNVISIIENLDTLEKLIILSLGNNMIDNIKGIARFRFLSHLKVLNLEGNPVTDRFNMADYIAAILPNVVYYDYMCIENEDRKRAKEQFHRELREIEANEEVELMERARKIKMERDAAYLSHSFVEYLNEDQLFQSLWKEDTNCHILIVDQEAEDLKEEYGKDIYAVTQEIYKLGIERYKERQSEIQEFMIHLEEGQSEAYNFGQQTLQKFIEYKEETLKQAGDYYKCMEAEIETEQNINRKLDELTNIFHDKINDVGEELMRIEMHVHETVEEVTLNFQQNMRNLTKLFVEQAQIHFSQLRDLVAHFSENLFDIVARSMGTALSTRKIENVPGELKRCVEDRKAIKKLIVGMKGSHTLHINERENRLIERSKEYVDNMMEKLKNDEMKRNRSRVLEINTFLDVTIESLQTLSKNIK